MNDIVAAPQITAPQVTTPHYPPSQSHHSMPALQVIRRNGTVVAFDAERSPSR